MDITTVAPVRANERLKSLDALRGFALLGILVPNIVAFGWPGMAMIDYTIMGETDANHLAHSITSTVFLGKFMFNFALLFGAGVIVYAHKYDQGDTPTKLSTGGWLWHRRCLILLGFGLIHAYLFWYGDILTWYAVAGLTLLWWIRRWPRKWLLAFAIGSYALSAIILVGFSAMGLWAVEAGHVAKDELMGAGSAAEIAAYTGTWFDALRIRFGSTIFMHLFLLPLYMPALWGMMAMGMYLTRTGILGGERTGRFYVISGVLGVVLGGALTLGMYALLGAGHGWQSSFIWQPLAQPIGVPLALGYTMLVIAMTKSNALNFITTPLAAVGRMALTNYFLHTLLCTTFFYGYGFGKFASLDYPALWGVIGVVWCVNIVFSLLWLRVFRFGPIEWVWRCMTYGKVLPILHTRSTSAQG